MVDMSSDFIMQNVIIDCYNTRKNEMFVTIDSVFNERTGYSIELLFMFRSRLSRVDNKEISLIDAVVICAACCANSGHQHLKRSHDVPWTKF